MTAQQHPVLQTLTAWSEIAVKDDTATSAATAAAHDKVDAKTISHIHGIATAKRGKAQKIPSRLLQPV